VEIRKATRNDAARLAELNGVLGYPVTAEVMAERLEGLLKSETDTILVADDDGTVAGWIHGRIQEILAAGRMGEICGLVVADDQRGRGVGRQLAEAVEKWVHSRGLESVTVRSNVVRPESHAFYERIGYVRFKTQHAYRKKLSS
jgi:N-acetylglutamate synthase-like GNAT family acetyltransferase